MEAAMTKSMFIVERAQALRSRMHRDLQCASRLKANGRVHDAAPLLDKLYSFFLCQPARELLNELVLNVMRDKFVRLFLFFILVSNGGLLKWRPLSCVCVSSRDRKSVV